VSFSALFPSFSFDCRLFLIVIVCLSVRVAWLLRVEAWLINSEDQELRTTIEAEVEDLEDRNRRLLSSYTLGIKASAGTL